MNYSSILNEIEIATEASVIHQLIDNIIEENKLNIRPEMDYEYNADLLNQVKVLMFTAISTNKEIASKIYMLDSVIIILREAQKRLNFLEK